MEGDGWHADHFQRDIEVVTHVTAHESSMTTLVCVRSICKSCLLVNEDLSAQQTHRHKQQMNTPHIPLHGLALNSRSSCNTPGSSHLGGAHSQRCEAVRNVHIRVRRAERSTRAPGRSRVRLISGPTPSGAATAAHCGRGPVGGAAAFTTPTLLLCARCRSLHCDTDSQCQRHELLGALFACFF